MQLMHLCSSAVITPSPAAPSLLAMSPPFTEATAVQEQFWFGQEVKMEADRPQHQVLSNTGGRM